MQNTSGGADGAAPVLPARSGGHTATLGALADAVSLGGVPPAAREIEVGGIARHSGAVRPGDLFVAASGTPEERHEYARQAAANGAAAVLVDEEPPSRLGVPTIVVQNARHVLADLAAEWHGCPAERLSIAGITGTVGKTSVLAMTEAILLEAGLHVGAIGSLGVSVEGDPEPTGYTAPDPLLLHEALARIEKGGVELVVMEITSHALVQERVHGLECDLGIFTNLVPFEHSDYHGSFRDYVRAKSRFFDHVRPGAPMVYAWDDRSVRRLVRERDFRAIGCGTGRLAPVRLERLEIGADGTTLTVHARRSIPRVDADDRPPFAVPLRLELLGRSNALNAGLAATAAISLGAEPEHAAAALARLEAPRRRMEFLHRGRFQVLDDTIGHPDSVSALFEVLERIPAQHRHAVFAVRGTRGPRINARTAEALAIWHRRQPLDTLVVTRSADGADARNVVSDEERDAFVHPLREAGIPFREIDTLDEAVPAVLDAASDDDLVLFLGAQGMDGAAERALRWLEDAGERENG